MFSIVLHRRQIILFTWLLLQNILWSHFFANIIYNSRPTKMAFCADHTPNVCEILVRCLVILMDFDVMALFMLIRLSEQCNALSLNHRAIKEHRHSYGECCYGICCMVKGMDSGWYPQKIYNRPFIIWQSFYEPHQIKNWTLSVCVHAILMHRCRNFYLNAVHLRTDLKGSCSGAHDHCSLHLQLKNMIAE